MRTVRRLAPPALLLGVFAALAAPAAAWKMPAALYEVSCVVSPGTQWTAGDTLHIRGRASESILYDTGTFEIVGSNAVILNGNIDLTTGEASYFGTFSSTYLPLSTTGTLDGRWHASSGPEILFAGRAVGHGTGDLRRVQARLDLQGLDVPEIPLPLLFILSQPPWSDCPQISGVVFASGRFQGAGSG